MRNGRRDGRHAKRAPRARAGPPAAWEPYLLNFPQLTLALRRWLPGSCASARLSELGDRSKQPIAKPSDAEPQGASDWAYKVREEIEVVVADAGVLTRIFEGLGMNGWFRYEKYRTTFQLPDSEAWAKGLLIELDETPIGTFVELEGPTAAIDHAPHGLAYSKREYVLKTYLRLYIEDCRRKGEQPSHMLFPKRK